MVLVVERMREDLGAEIGAVSRQLVLRQRVGTANELAGDAAARAAFAAPVLHALHLHVVPVLREGAEDAAVVRQVAVEVGGTLPSADRGQMRRLQRRDPPLVHRVVRDAVQPDFTGAPRAAFRPT